METARKTAAALFEAARAAKSRTLFLITGVVVCVRFAALQLASLGRPLSVFDMHHWRSAFTYGVAWNFAHGAGTFFRPRMFVEHANSNVVAMEPPLYPLLASFVLRVFGDGVFGPRLISWLALVAVVVVLVRWLEWPERAGLFVALAVSPMMIAEFRTMQPEPLCAGFAMGAAFFLARYAEKARSRDAAFGLALTALAVFTKPVALGTLPALFLFGAWGMKDLRRRVLVLGISFVAIVGLYALWDSWAQHLRATEMKNLVFIAIEHDTKEMIANLHKPEHERHVVLFLLPCYATSYWLVPAVVAGAYRGIADPKWRRLAVPLVVWLAGYLFELVAVGDRLGSNWYYLLLAGGPIAFFAALGLGALVRVLDGEKPRLVLFQAALIVGALVPLGALAPRAPWHELSAGALGIAHHRNNWTSDVGLLRLMGGILLVFACGARLRPRRIPAWFAAAVAILVVGSGIKALRDADQYFRYHMNAERRPTFPTELAALRAAVDRHSRREHEIVVSPGGSDREPSMIYFEYARRNGFPWNGDLGAPIPETFRARGARLLLRVELPGADPPSTNYAGTRLADGPWWRLHCIADDGCPPVSP